MAGLRQACDRCHDRCSKPAGSLVCDRCAKAKTQCIFSPPTRSLRSGISSQDNPFDWLPMMGLDPMPSAVSDGPEQSVAAPGEVPQLTDLMASLEAIYYEFPPPDMKHLPADRSREFTESMAATFHLKSTLEQLLRRTHQLASTYPTVLKLVVQKAGPTSVADEACTIPDCMHQVRESLRSRPQPTLDLAVLNLLLACHLRLLDIIDNVLDHARLCAHAVQDNLCRKAKNRNSTYRRYVSAPT